MGTQPWDMFLLLTGAVSGHLVSADGSTGSRYQLETQPNPGEAHPSAGHQMSK